METSREVWQGVQRPPQITISEEVWEIQNLGLTSWRGAL